MAGFDSAKHPRVPGGKGGGEFAKTLTGLAHAVGGDDEQRKRLYGADALGKPSPWAAKPKDHGLPWKTKGDTVHYDSHLGVARKDMPQLSGIGPDGKYHGSREMTPKFLDFLGKRGVTVTRRNFHPTELRPTQTSGDTKAIRGIADQLHTGELDDAKPILVSADRRVLDGHHNWAGKLLSESEGGRAGASSQMRTHQASVDMRDLIKLAKEFSAQQGIKQRGAGEFANPEFARDTPEAAYTKGVGLLADQLDQKRHEIAANPDPKFQQAAAKLGDLAGSLRANPGSLRDGSAASNGAIAFVLSLGDKDLADWARGVNKAAGAVAKAGRPVRRGEALNGAGPGLAGTGTGPDPYGAHGGAADNQGLPPDGAAEGASRPTATRGLGWDLAEMETVSAADRA